MKRFSSVLFIGLIIGLFAASAMAQERVRRAPWSQEVLDAAAKIPVQERGRVKPLHTYAGFLLLSLNGKRSCETPWKEKLTPVAWLLDCWFFPEQARHYEVVSIDDYRVVEAIGVSREGKLRRDRYSMAELDGGISRLMDMARDIESRETAAASRVESQVVSLARRLPALFYTLGYMDFARQRVPVSDAPELAKLFPGKTDAGMLDLVPKVFELEEIATAQTTHGPVSHALETLNQVHQGAGFLAMIPPVIPTEEVYETPQDVMSAMAEGRRPDHAATLRQIESAYLNRGTMPRLESSIIALQEDLSARATVRGENDKIDLEIHFYEMDYFYNAMALFVFGFLFNALLWFKPKLKALSNTLYYGAWTLAGLGQTLLISGIVVRCILRSRPPVTTPYEVILFIAAVGILVMMFVEYTRRNGLSLSLTNSLGALALVYAAWHEGAEGVDTMQPLIAVLDTNFWLSTHVTTIAIGYCAGVLAAVLGNVYIFSKLWNLSVPDKSRHVGTKFFGDLAKITYGVLCFGVLFSTVGTILGGVWANDSWGRFWGWDPKENGALMLVLGFLATLHARMGGHLREHGIAVASVFLGIIVIWAFYGVNLYGIGLHSYGFDESKSMVTKVYYAIQGSVLLLGIATWCIPRLKKAGG